MLPLEVFDQKLLVEYLSREKWLSEIEALLLFDGIKFYTDELLFEGRVGESFALGAFVSVFKPKFTPF
jgi:hypothetical protein